MSMHAINDIISESIDGFNSRDAMARKAKILEMALEEAMFNMKKKDRLATVTVTQERTTILESLSRGKI